MAINETIRATGAGGQSLALAALIVSVYVLLSFLCRKREDKKE